VSTITTMRSRFMAAISQNRMAGNGSGKSGGPSKSTP
jgi:hypothetical protein